MAVAGIILEGTRVELLSGIKAIGPVSLHSSSVYVFSLMLNSILLSPQFVVKLIERLLNLDIYGN